MTKVSERLEEIVCQSGLKSPEFAELMNISSSTQRNYEKGLRYPTLEYLETLAKHGYDIFYLITGKRDIGRQSLSEEDSEVLRLWHAAPLLVRHAALNVLATGQTQETANRIGDITGSIITGGIKQSGG